MKLVDYIVDENCPIVEAMKSIDRNAKGIVYVTRSNRLVGALTDGDVRRHIIRGGELSQQVSSIMNKTPLHLTIEEEKKALNFMKSRSIRSVPIVYPSGVIVKIIFDDCTVEDRKKIDVPVVIMAGGKGTRLYPYTQILPKPLIPIGEKTITEHIMSHFEEYGCLHFDMIVNYKKHFIKSYFQDSEKNIDVRFIEETEYLGTGGGLKLLEGKYDTTFFMTNCDILIEEDYAKILEYHQDKHNIITMVCAEKNMVIPYGTVEVSDDGKVSALKEKPSLSFITNTGFYVIEPEFLDMIPENTFIHITDVIQSCIDTGKDVGVYTIPEDKWLDMGQMEEMEKMKKKLNL